MTAEVGSAFISIRPSLVGFHKQIAKDLKALGPQVAKIGKQIGSEFSKGFELGLGDPLSGPLESSSRKQQSRAPKNGESVAGAFAKGFSARLKAAFESLPAAKIDADSSAADKKISELRARMEALSGKTIGVDIDAGTAITEIAGIKAELDDLGRSKDVAVRVDAGAAAAELAAVQAEVDRIDGRTANVRVDADVAGALAGIQTVGIAMAGLAAIPVGATLGVGILGMVPALAAAGAGFGGLAAVAVPALNHIKGALQAQKQATAQSAAGSGQAQSQALAEAGAQRALAAAVRNAGYAHTQALQQVRSAEQQLTSAQQSAVNAQRALTKARQEAQQSLQDMANQVADAQLAVRQSTFDAADAQAQYNRVLADPHATKDQIARSKLALDQAKQTLTEQETQLKRITADQRAADKAGVEGSDRVRSARQALTQANVQVANSERALSQARANVARTDAASADQIASARQALAQASLQGASASGKLAAAMASLSPSARTLMKDWLGLTDAFGKWERSLEPAVLPLFSRGINLLKASLPALTPIVRGAAKAVDGLITDVANAAKSPFWQQVRTNITNLVPTSVTGFGHIFGNLATGLAGVVNAFLPYAPRILGFVTSISAGFANWGKGLGTSNGFSKFMDYVQQAAPTVLKTLTELAQTVVHVVAALAPLGPGILGPIGLLLRFVNMLKPGEIQAVAIAFGVLSTAIWAVNAAMDANPVVLIAVAILALVAAVVIAYDHVGWFHDAVVAAWNGIKTAALFVWSSVLKPVFAALVVAVQAVASAGMWLWRNVLVPAFNAIAVAARILFAVVAVAVLAPLMIVFNALKTTVLALWHAAIVPAFNGIKSIISGTWTIIKPLFDLWVAGVRLLGSAAMWLWTSAIGPAWHGIGSLIKSVYTTLIKPVFSALNMALKNVIAPVFKWIYSSVIRPQFQAIGTVIHNVWTGVIRPTFDALKTGVGYVKTAFKTAVDAVGKIWRGLESATRRPVQFVVDTVYNNGIRKVWNTVADLVHLPQLGAVKFATGGILPGYTPGRDPHEFVSPTGGRLALSGGEAIMRPEFTRAVGSGFVHTANKVARQSGPGGVRNWLANGDMKFARGGVLPGGGGPVQKFAFGGILDAVKHAGSLVVHGASSLLDGGASAFAKHLLDPILGKIPGGDSPFAKGIYSLPTRMVDGFLSFLKSQVDPKLGGDGLGVVAQAKKFVGIGDDRGPNNNMWTRAWGMPGAPWCAMFVSDMIKRAGAQKHYPGYPTAAVAGYNGAMRHVSVSDGKAGDLGVYGGGAHVNIIAGKKGGAYDTYGGNQNAVVQHRVRGGQTSILRPKFANGGILGRQAQQIFKNEAPRNADLHEMQTPLVQLMRSLPAGQMGHVARAIVNKKLEITNAGVYDNGGVIPPGLNIVANASRKPEAILNGAQWAAITSAATAGRDAYHSTYNLYQRDMTIRDLEALQRQQEVRQRIGRPH